MVRNVKVDLLNGVTASRRIGRLDQVSAGRFQLVRLVNFYFAGGARRSAAEINKPRHEQDEGSSDGANDHVGCERSFRGARRRFLEAHQWFLGGSLGPFSQGSVWQKGSAFLVLRLRCHANAGYAS